MEVVYIQASLWIGREIWLGEGFWVVPSTPQAWLVLIQDISLAVKESVGPLLDVSTKPRFEVAGSLYRVNGPEEKRILKLLEGVPPWSSGRMLWEPGAKYLTALSGGLGNGEN